MMKSSKMILPILAGAFSASAALFADVAATKLAPAQSIFPNSYGKADLRYYFVDNSKNEIETLMQSRFVLGSTFFDGDLDVRGRFGLTKYISTQDDEKNPTVFEPRKNLLQAEYKVLDYDNGLIGFKLAPYLETTFENGGGSSTDLGLWVPLSFEQSFASGTAFVEAEYKLAAVVGSSAEKIAVVDTNGETVSNKTANDLGLAGSTIEDDQPFEVEQDKSTVKQYAAYQLGFKPALVKGLSVAIGSEHQNKLVPIMEVDGKKVGAKKSEGVFSLSEYDNQYKVEHFAELKYALNDTLTLSNTLSVTGAQENGKRDLTNLVKLSAVLF